MKLATMSFSKDKVTIVVPGQSPEEFDRKDLEKAAERLTVINEGLVAASMPTAGKIELISKDGKAVHGIPTTQATNAAVFTSKAKKAGDPDKVTTELDLCEIAGYVIVSRDHGGRVQAAWGNPANFGRYQPISEAGLLTLRGVLVPAE